MSKEAIGTPILDLRVPDKVNGLPRSMPGRGVKVRMVGYLRTRLAALACKLEPANRPRVSKPAKIKVRRERLSFIGRLLLNRYA